MGKVADPSGGSYYVEKLTELLAREVWKLFVRLEEEGGFIESLKKGIVQSIIKGSAEKRINDIVEKKEILLGTNLYPDTGELSKPEVKKDQKIDDEADSVVKGFECIKLLRGAEEIENRRLANK
jgi:methylmalonyl-CoA mutase